MQARDLMNAPVVTIRPDATVGDAADLMLERQVSCLPVLDEQDRLVGILTHTDFALQHRFMPMVEDLATLLGSWATPQSLEAVAREVRDKLVKDVMQRNVITVEEDASVARVAGLMLSKNINRLPVMREGKLVGIITRHDLLKLMASSEG